MPLRGLARCGIRLVAWRTAQHSRRTVRFAGNTKRRLKGFGNPFSTLQKQFMAFSEKLNALWRRHPLVWITLVHVPYRSLPASNGMAVIASDNEHLVVIVTLNQKQAIAGFSVGFCHEIILFKKRSKDRSQSALPAKHRDNRFYFHGVSSSQNVGGQGASCPRSTASAGNQSSATIASLRHTHLLASPVAPCLA